MYVVVEQTCEFCDAINDHLTADCPHLADQPFMFRSVRSFMGWFAGRADTLMFLAGVLAR